MNEAQDEQLLDKRIQARLASDAAYNRAENAEQQAEREAEIERQEVERLEREQTLARAKREAWQQYPEASDS